MIKDNDAFGPVAVVLVAVLYRAMFTASWFVEFFQWMEWTKPEVVITNVWGWIEYALLVGAAIYVLRAETNIEHRFTKVFALFVVFVSTLGGKVEFARELMVGFMVFGVAEWLLIDRQVVNTKNAFVDEYAKDWFIAGLIAVSWIIRSLVLMFFDKPEEGYFVASIIPLACFIIAGILTSFGKDQYNKTLQWAFLVVAIPSLFSAYADCVMYYWFLVNIGLKFTEIIYKHNFISSLLPKSE